MNDFKPGCYGSYVLFNTVKAVCQPCIYRAECRLEAKKNCTETMAAVAELKAQEESCIYSASCEHKAINNCTKGSEAPETSLASAYKIVFDAEKFGKLPTKSKPIAIKLSKQSLGIKTFMKSGNAVTCKPEFMMIAINQLSVGFTKKQLKQAFIDKLEWTDSTAASHVSLAVPVLEALELSVMDSSGVIRSKIKPE